MNLNQNPQLDGLDAVSDELIKAMSAGLETGMQYANQENNGGGLKVESLDPMIKVLEFSQKQLVLWNQISKQKIYNTVHQYNQLVKYGDEFGMFNLEGETPQFTDSVYRRKPIITKFMGVGGSVTHPMSLVKLAGVGDMYQKEVENKTILLLQKIEKALVTANSSIVPEEFDGIFKQHVDGVLDIYGGINAKTSEAILDAYYGDVAVVNADGNILSDLMIQKATNAIVNERYGFASAIMANPIVFTDYTNDHTNNKVFNVGGVGNMMGNMGGLQVTNIATQFGNIDFIAAPFWDRKVVKMKTSPKSNDKSPNAPTKVADATANNADTKTKFTNHAGNYLYAVTAKNRYGESAMTMLKDTAIAVTATQSVDLSFSASTGSSYPETGYVVYRTKKDDTNPNTAKFYPIFEVSSSELASGYDGAAAGKVRDRNRSIAGTTTAMVYTNSNELLEYLQLSDTMKMDLAITSPSKRFLVLNYGTPVMYAPGKIVMIKNIAIKS